MKILHVADVHMGLVTHGRPAEHGINSAILSSQRCLAAAVDAAIEHQVDAAIVAGDLYHDHSPAAIALVLVAEQLRRLTNEGIEVVLVPGNHDRGPHAGQPSILEAHAGPGIQVESAPFFVELAPSGLRIGTFPSVSRHQAHAARPDWRADTDQLVVDVMAGLLDTYRSMSDPPDVVVGHWPVQGSVLGDEADVSLISEPVIPAGALEGPWYAALGHLHYGQMIQHEGVFGAYSGSLDRISFSEALDPKAALIVDLDAHAIEAVPLPARRLIQLEVDPEGNLPLPLADLLPGAVVKIKGSARDGGNIEEFMAAARKALAAADSVMFEIHRKRAERPVVEQIVKAPGPLEAIEEWAKANDLEEPDRLALVGYASELMERAS